MENEIDKEWEAFKIAQSELLAKQREFLNNPAFVKKAGGFLNSPDAGNFLIFCQSLIDEEDRNIIKLLFKDIVDTALKGNPTTIALSRGVIKTLDNKWLKDNLYPKIIQILVEVETEEPEENYWAHQRTYELLEYVGFEDEISDFLEKCRNHPDPDVVEIYIDYYPKH